MFSVAERKNSAQRCAGLRETLWLNKKNKPQKTPCDAVGKK